MVFAHEVLVRKSRQNTELVAAIDASKVDICGVLLQEDTSGYLRPCAYWTWELKFCEIRYSISHLEILAGVEALSWVWRVYSIGCIECFLIVIDHAITIIHVMKQSSNILTDR
jgi:hypothetical protein